MKPNHSNETGIAARPAAMPLLAALACALVVLASSAGSLALTREEAPTTAAPGNPDVISARPPRPMPKPLKCINVSRRWQLCGSASKTQLTAGVGIRFNRIDPKGRIVASRSYDDCGKLAADDTLPADVRARAVRQCKRSFHLAAKQAVQ